MPPLQLLLRLPLQLLPLLLLLLLLLLLMGRAAAQYVPGSTTYAAPGAVGFTPNNIVVVRLAHPSIRNRSFSLSAAVFLDEFYAPNASDDLLVLKQTIALPSSSDGLPSGQYALTTHGNDLQSIHSLNHGGMFNREYPRWRAARRPRPPFAAASANPASPRAPSPLYHAVAYDGTRIIVSGVTTPPGTQMAAARNAAVGGTWTTPVNGSASNIGTLDMVAGHVDYQGYIDISSIAKLG